MGIHNLNKLLKKECGDMFETVPLKKYAYKKIAIDTSLYMYKYKVIFSDEWLRAFANLVWCLRKNDVHPLFLFDSKDQLKNLKNNKIVVKKEKTPN